MRTLSEAEGAIKVDRGARCRRFAAWMRAASRAGAGAMGARRQGRLNREGRERSGLEAVDGLHAAVLQDDEVRGSARPSHPFVAELVIELA
jgi:hypothetical protein